MSQRIGYRTTRASRTSAISAAAVAALALSACQDAVAPVPTPMPARPSLSATISISGPVDLGTMPGGFDALAVRVNNLQHAVGRTSVPGSTHAVLWTAPGAAIDLGLLPGGSWSGASAIADVTAPGGTEYVAGGADVPCTAAGCVFATIDHAFRWDPVGGMIDLGTLGGLRSGAAGVDQFGTVVGWSDTRNGPEHAFVWTPLTGMRDLGSVPPGRGDRGAQDYDGLALAGFAVVSVAGRSQQLHAVRWSPLTRWEDLGTLPGGTWSFGMGINSLGWVAGNGPTATSSSHAILWKEPQQPIDLGVLPSATDSYAMAVNDAGWVVGESGRDGFVWTAADGMLALPTLGAAYGTSAHDINGGVAVGSSEFRAVMWILTPAP